MFINFLGGKKKGGEEELTIAVIKSYTPKLILKFTNSPVTKLVAPTVPFLFKPYFTSLCSKSTKG